MALCTTFYSSQIATVTRQFPRAHSPVLEIISMNNIISDNTIFPVYTATYVAPFIRATCILDAGLHDTHNE